MFLSSSGRLSHGQWCGESETWSPYIYLLFAGHLWIQIFLTMWDLLSALLCYRVQMGFWIDAAQFWYAFVALHVIEMFLKIRVFLVGEQIITSLWWCSLYCICCIHKRSTNQNVTANIILQYGYNANSHIHFLSMGLSKMGRATQSQRYETPLLLYLQLSCKSKGFDCNSILASSTNMNFRLLTLRALF